MSIKIPKRAKRLMMKERVIAKARRVALQNGFPVERFIRNADHLKSCSCWMCGNQRKTFGPPIREVRQTTVMDEISMLG